MRISRQIQIRKVGDRLLRPGYFFFSVPERNGAKSFPEGAKSPKGRHTGAAAGDGTYGVEAGGACAAADRKQNGIIDSIDEPVTLNGIQVGQCSDLSPVAS
ncbi:MAG: hypothetical protein ACHQPI_09350 [Thermoanaerobaculia bacterium]